MKKGKKTIFNFVLIFAVLTEAVLCVMLLIHVKNTLSLKKVLGEQVYTLNKGSVVFPKQTSLTYFYEPPPNTAEAYAPHFAPDAHR